MNFEIIILHISNKMWIDVLITENADEISFSLTFRTFKKLLILIKLLVRNFIFSVVFNLSFVYELWSNWGKGGWG